MIPPYNEYLVSYKGQDIVLSLKYMQKAYNNGIFQPIIAHDVIVCGKWTPYEDNLNPSFFLGEHNSSIMKEWEVYKKYLFSY